MHTSLKLTFGSERTHSLVTYGPEKALKSDQPYQHFFLSLKRKLIFRRMEVMNMNRGVGRHLPMAVTTQNQQSGHMYGQCIPTLSFCYAQIMWYNTLYIGKGSKPLPRRKRKKEKEREIEEIERGLTIYSVSWEDFFLPWFSDCKGF